MKVKRMKLLGTKWDILVPGTMAYDSFWNRVAAKVIDFLIVSGLNHAFYAVWKGHNPFASEAFEATMAITLLMFWIAYSTGFVARFGATPGKMVFRLKVVTSKGQAISTVRALGRSFADILSGILLYGYLMAVFDHEQRTLHDRICDTRVIGKQGDVTFDSLVETQPEEEQSPVKPPNSKAPSFGGFIKEGNDE